MAAFILKKSRVRTRFAVLVAGFLSAVSSASAANDDEGGENEPIRKVRLDSIRVDNGVLQGTLQDGTVAELTLQPELQAASARLMALARPLAGAVVMLDVDTGNVVALSSYRRDGAPPGDPLSTEVPSASLFKLVTTAALFEHTNVSPTTEVCFLGGERRIEREHLDAPHDPKARCAPFSNALGHSWNAVYAQVATQHLMRDQLLQTAQKLGFDAPLTFEGDANFGSVDLPYNDLEFARAAAGFQGNSFTPLGAAQLTFGIALGGRPAKMRLIRRVGDYDAPRGREFLDRIMSANAAWRLTRMMEVTVHGGTSLRAFTKEDGSSYLGAIRVAGKTGTLQRKDNGPTTSWFTGFAPSRDPKVVVTVMLQNGDVWREKANEVARDLLRFYFAGKPGVQSPFE